MVQGLPGVLIHHFSRFAHFDPPVAASSAAQHFPQDSASAPTAGAMPRPCAAAAATHLAPGKRTADEAGVEENPLVRPRRRLSTKTRVPSTSPQRKPAEQQPHDAAAPASGPGAGVLEAEVFVAAGARGAEPERLDPAAPTPTERLSDSPPPSPRAARSQAPEERPECRDGGAPMGEAAGEAPDTAAAGAPHEATGEVHEEDTAHIPAAAPDDNKETEPLGLFRTAKSVLAEREAQDPARLQVAALSRVAALEAAVDRLRRRREAVVDLLQILGALQVLEVP